MEQGKKVSVILCLYNVSSFLREKRLSCILGQSYRNLEIILVNDGSTDDTQILCEQLAAEDARVIIVQKENGGLGSARNAGLDRASGEYVWFYDVDDEAETQLIEKNVQWMEHYHTDMNIFGYWCVTPSLNLTEEVHFTEHTIQSNEQLRSIFIDDLLLVPNGNGFAWNKFYRRSFIEAHKFRFGNQRIQQDEVFNLQFYPLLGNVYISSELLYHYFIYSSGNNRSRYIQNRITIYTTIFNKFVSFSHEWNLRDERLQHYIFKRYYSGIEASLLFNLFHKDSPCSLTERKKEFDTILSTDTVLECFKFIRENVTMSLEQRLFFHAFIHKNFWMVRSLMITFSFLRTTKRKITSI